MPSALFHNYRAQNETDNMQHTAVLSDANFSVVCFTKLTFLQNCSYETNEVLSNNKSFGLSVQRDNKQHDP
jgi:hypothetical protein